MDEKKVKGKSTRPKLLFSNVGFDTRDTHPRGRVEPEVVLLVERLFAACEPRIDGSNGGDGDVPSVHSDALFVAGEY